MGEIIILKRDIVGKIAAGEVIESPASVVKELLENSIDANSKKISIDVVDSGKSLIKVADDGDGMAKDDLRLCIKRHSTSKIKTLPDLYNITSLGFRGEALASIAAVSKIKIISKTEKQKEGQKIELVDENVINEEKVGCNKGTIIEINELFYNTPVRKKFMKTSAREVNAMVDVVTRCALVYKDIFFKLTHNKKTLVNSPKAKKDIENIINIYGNDVAKNLVKVNYISLGIKITGFVSTPSLTRSDKTHESFFVNRRQIKSALLSNAAHDAYHTLLNVGRHPIIILNLEIDPKEIDINVHPSKKKIKFEQEGVVYNVVFEAAKSTLMKNNLIESAEQIGTRQAFLKKEKPIKSPKKTEIKIIKEKQELLEKNGADDLLPNKRFVEDSKIPEMRIIGNFYNTYILAEFNEGLLILDQHAAHERVNYELLMKKYNDAVPDVQSLVRPEVIELSPVDRNIVENNFGLLKEMGFSLENFGENSYVLRTVPILINKQQSKEVITDIIDDIAKLSKLDRMQHIKEKMLITMACKGSIKAHDKITEPQIKKLIYDLSKCDNPYTCPHGRPTIIKFTIKDLEKKFRRII